MSDFIHLNSAYLNYLTPLLKWRVLDLDNLRKECFNVPEYHNFCKVIRRLEREKILEGYRNPFNRKKYVYLSAFGEGQLSIKENPTALSKETLIHDIKVSEIAKVFLEKGWANDVELEHQLNDKRNFKTTYKIIPDALLHGEKSGIKFKMAFELELSRKNNQRILAKANQYQESSFYNYVVYLFSKKNLMDKYIEIISESLREKSLSRFMFFVDPLMTGAGTKLEEVKGIFKGKEVTMREVFEK